MILYTGTSINRPKCWSSLASRIFPTPATTLREASVHKLDLVCRKLGLGPDHRVLEIGTGWGSFAIHAARHYGCRVTTTTISPAQRQMAIERIRAAGLSDRIEVLGTDYRDLSGTFDRLVSIEMIEAVGHANLPAYFRACADRLRPGGAMLLQAITMPDRDYQDYLASVDYIQRYVFPGSCLPSLGAITRAVAHTDLRVDHVESIGHHYGETLRRWRRAFTAAARRGQGARIRRTIRAALDLLPVLLRSGFRGALRGRPADGSREAGMETPLDASKTISYSEVNQWFRQGRSNGT